MGFVKRTTSAMEVVGDGMVPLVLLGRERWRATMEVPIYGFLEDMSVKSRIESSQNVQSSACGKEWGPSPD
jgi:hypothetical protein